MILRLGTKLLRQLAGGRCGEVDPHATGVFCRLGEADVEARAVGQRLHDFDFCVFKTFEWLGLNLWKIIEWRTKSDVDDRRPLSWLEVGAQGAVDRLAPVVVA